MGSEIDDNMLHNMVHIWDEKELFCPIHQSEYGSLEALVLSTSIALINYLSPNSKRTLNKCYNI